jgi:hypothetical protein
MAELTRESLPPAGPDYPVWSGTAVPGAAPVVQRKRRPAGDDAPGPRLLPEEPERDADERTGDGI